MLSLKHTQALMQQKLADEWVGDYAVYVGIGDEELAFYSPNADGDSLFDIASCGKVLHTAPLIYQAIGEGKCALTDTLDKFFENVPEEKKNITLKQLLTHTSGIVRVPLPKEVCDQGDEAVGDYILQSPLQYTPGTDTIYSCNGTILLGYIAEKLLGQSFEELFLSRIHKPLGLTRSCFKVEVDTPNVVICYNRRDREESCFDDANIRALGGVRGSGGSFFTLNDVRKFVEAVRRKDERLYPAEFYQSAEVNYTPDFAEGRGLGYLVVSDKYHQTGRLFPNGSFGHCGHCGQSFFLNRELDLRVILLTNATRYLNRKSNFTGYDYGKVMALREEIHNEIHRDLVEEGLLHA